MNRSKTLLASNILATIYSAFLLWTIGVPIIEAGGIDFIYALGSYFDIIFNFLGAGSDTLVLLYVILVLICIHIITFVLGTLIGWLAFAGKKSGGAKFAASLYLIGTICFPIYIFFGLPITIVGFIGGGKQKKLNQPNCIPQNPQMQNPNL